MRLLGYGEDFLTLWAINNRLKTILEEIEDISDPEKCTIFFRPSFGRSGGELSSQFGGFDFIIITTKGAYLGESKWDNSSELKESSINLRDEQLLRHKLFLEYINTWLETKPQSWEDFSSNLSLKLKGINLKKNIAPLGSLLQQNIQYILKTITNSFNSCKDFKFKNVLLFLYNKNYNQSLPTKVNSKDLYFNLVCLDYSENMDDKFIDLKL